MHQDERHAAPRQTILLVHGRDFKPPPQTLFEISLEAIRAGIERDYPGDVEAFEALNKDMAYYGDLTNQYLESAGGHYDEQLDIGDRRNALAALRRVPARRRFGIRQYDRLPGKSAVREFIADVAAPIMGAVGLAQWLISRVSKDFWEYLCGHSDYAVEVRRRVRDKLCESLARGDRVLLLCHGTGCVAAYEVLWQLSHAPEYAADYGTAKVDLWVTLGSPLGDNFIRKHLLGTSRGGPASFPASVITWVNVSAEDDYTCHDNTVADDFKRMLQARLVSAVRDYRVYNLAVRYGRSNPHSSVGYFIHPRVAKLVVDWMREGREERVGTTGTSP